MIESIAAWAQQPVEPATTRTAALRRLRYRELTCLGVVIELITTNGTEIRASTVHETTIIADGSQSIGSNAVDIRLRLVKPGKSSRTPWIRERRSARRYRYCTMIPMVALDELPEYRRTMARRLALTSISPRPLVADASVHRRQGTIPTVLLTTFGYRRDAMSQYLDATSIPAPCIPRATE